MKLRSSFLQTKKCAVVRRGNGFSHDLAERKPSRRKGGVAVIACYVQYGHFLYFIF